MEKEFAVYMFSRLQPQRVVELVNSFALKAEEKKILIDCFVTYKASRGWQKQAAYAENVEINTISKRYNKALGKSSLFLIAYISRVLNVPEK